ncbi:NAD(P)-dependent oxidoreductase [candidate division CSSED10-310 bacterium]|uniref:NAD(P)-dependent oxidoreductase n=1 Tax=candidate division CSSED10-310 bacterium TaxID=2855610 RepID=A0ABV6Z460_UNCC1
MKVLIATVKPFAPAARDAVSDILKQAGHEVVVLESYTSNDEFLQAVADADAMVVRSDKVTEAVLDAAQNLKIVVRAGAGYDNIDCYQAREKNIVVENTPGQNSNAVAELAFGMMIMLARNTYDGKPGSELKGKKLGLHAFGYAAQAVAKVAQGFSMEVYAFDPFLKDDFIKAHSVTPCHSVEELYALADYISIHIPATPETVKSINAELLGKMKDNATLINTARKEVIDEEDLGRIFAVKPGFKYAADIAPDDAVKQELGEKYPTRCFFTPKKMAAQTVEANFNAACAAGRQIVAFFETGERRFQVN